MALSLGSGNPGHFQFTFVSRQCESLLGYPPDQWLARADFWEQHLHPEDAARVVQTAKDSVARTDSLTIKITG